MPPKSDSKFLEKRRAALNAVKGKGHEIVGAFHTIPPYGGDPVRDRPMMNTAGCGFCLKVGEYDEFTLQKCKKCQRAFYCSRECQKADWIEHKRLCENWNEEDRKVVKMAWRVHHHPEFTKLIEREIGQKFLINFMDAKDLDSRKIRMIDVSVYFLPTTSDNHPKGVPGFTPDRKMQGFFQIHTVKKRTFPPPNISSPEIDKVRRLWAAHRQAADRAGLQLFPLFLVQYRYKTQPILLSSTVFTPQAFDALRNAGPTAIIIPEYAIGIPAGLPSGLRDVNRMIQSDDQNELGLIKWMSEYDKAICPGFRLETVTYDTHLSRD